MDIRLRIEKMGAPRENYIGTFRFQILITFSLFLLYSFNYPFIFHHFIVYEKIMFFGELKLCLSQPFLYAHFGSFGCCCNVVPINVAIIEIQVLGQYLKSFSFSFFLFFYYIGIRII